MAETPANKPDEPKVEETPKTEDTETKTATEVEDQPYLGTWKTKEAAEVGIENLQALLKRQSEELGNLRKQTNEYQKMLNDMKKPAEVPKEPGPDIQKEIRTVQEQISKLDQDDPDYQRDFGNLMAKQNQLHMQHTNDVAQEAIKKALTDAQGEFKKVLDERDEQSAYRDFYEANPDFNTEEIQMEIQDRIAKDRSGMMDPLVAFREIQRDNALAKAQELEQQLAEANRLLELRKGEDETGKVVTKSAQSPQQKTKTPKVTGAELDKGMQDVLNKQREKEAA